MFTECRYEILTTAFSCVHTMELAGVACGLLSRVSQKVSLQNGSFIRENELARRLFAGKPKPVSFEIDKNFTENW